MGYNKDKDGNYTELEQKNIDTGLGLERVKVYSMGDFSKEICGGPHVENTSELGEFSIIKEQSSSAGVRRIKAKLSKKPELGQVDRKSLDDVKITSETASDLER